MKTVLLMRHAKSSWDDPQSDDHARVLNARGLRTAPQMGQRLLEAGHVPDLIVSSSAERAQQTAQLVAESLGRADRIVVARQLYLAEPEAILRILRKTEDAVETLLLVGHNPGMEDLASMLAGSLQPFPTAAVAIFRQAGGWQAFAEERRPIHVASLRPKDGD